MPKKFWKGLIIGLLFILPFWVGIAFSADQNIYLDNAGAGAGSIGDPYGAFSEINWTTGGANSIFDWVAAGHDVIINLADDATWREQLTIGTSGASGHPITIQSYGSGADPIISGADLVTGWEAVPDVGRLTVDGDTIALYYFDEDLTDESGNGLDLTTTAGSPDYGTADLWDYTARGTGTWYAGNSSDTFDMGSGSWTIECTFKFTSDVGAKTLVHHDGSGAKWCLDQYGRGIRMGVWDGDEWFLTNDQTPDVSDGNWHNFAGVIDRGTNQMRMYVDNVQQGSTVDITTMGAINPNGSFQVGAEGAGDDIITNVTYISEVRFSDIARTTFPSTFAAGQANTWQVILATEPPDIGNLIFDSESSVGVKKSTLVACTSQGDFYYNTGAYVLDLYSTTDPDSALLHSLINII